MPTPKKTTKQSVSKKKAPAKKTAKKTVKKAPAKKQTTTKRAAAKKADAQPRVLVCAPEGKCFWTNDGQIIADMRELESVLNSMAKEIFAYHVNKEKNDFAEWVEHVLEDAACATDLRKAKTPKTAHTVVVRHLRYYSL